MSTTGLRWKGSEALMARVDLKTDSTGGLRNVLAWLDTISTADDDCAVARRLLNRELARRIDAPGVWFGTNDGIKPLLEDGEYESFTLRVQWPIPYGCELTDSTGALICTYYVLEGGRRGGRGVVPAEDMERLRAEIERRIAEGKAA